MYSLSTHTTTITEDEPIGCHFLNDNTVAACCRNSGKIITYDLRTGEIIGNINPSKWIKTKLKLRSWNENRVKCQIKYF